VERDKRILKRGFKGNLNLLLISVIFIGVFYLLILANVMIAYFGLYFCFGLFGIFLYDSLFGWSKMVIDQKGLFYRRGLITRQFYWENIKTMELGLIGERKYVFLEWQSPDMIKLNIDETKRQILAENYGRKAEDLLDILNEWKNG
jgi:uncharacterized membrane protein YobD (UPF0266 family)